MGLDLLFLFHHAKSRSETEIPIYRRKRENASLVNHSASPCILRIILVQIALLTIEMPLLTIEMPLLTLEMALLTIEMALFALEMPLLTPEIFFTTSSLARTHLTKTTTPPAPATP